jgi:hypothetical protein
MRNAFCGLLLFVSVTFAAPPKIDFDPITIKACTPTFIVVKTDAKTIIWDAPDAIEFTPQDKLASKTEPQITCKTVGEYTLTAVAISADGEGVKIKRKVTVVPWKPDPAPLPPEPPTPPIPVPPAPPEPVAKSQLYIYFVEATEDAVDIRGALFAAGLPLRKFQDAGKHFVAALPLNTNDPNFARYAQLAKSWKDKGNRLPYLAIFTKVEGQAKLLWEGTSPDAPGKILELFQKYGK